MWVDALDAYVAAQDRDDGWDAELLDELAGIFPSLRRPGAATPRVADERYRAHRAVRALLERLAEPNAAGARARRPALGRHAPRSS